MTSDEVIAVAPGESAENLAYERWREESKRAEREFRAATKAPRAELDAALEEADRRHKERIANAKRSVSVAGQAHRRDVELARIDYRKAIDLAEANLKEAMAKARAPVREAENSFKAAAEQSRRSLETDVAAARQKFEDETRAAYAERRKIKTAAWTAYTDARGASRPEAESK